MPRRSRFTAVSIPANPPPRITTSISSVTGSRVKPGRPRGRGRGRSRRAAGTARAPRRAAASPARGRTWPSPRRSAHPKTRTGSSFLSPQPEDAPEKLVGEPCAERTGVEVDRAGSPGRSAPSPRHLREGGVPVDGTPPVRDGLVVGQEGVFGPVQGLVKPGEEVTERGHGEVLPGRRSLQPGSSVTTHGCRDRRWGRAQAPAEPPPTHPDERQGSPDGDEEEGPTGPGGVHALTARSSRSGGGRTRRPGPRPRGSRVPAQDSDFLTTQQGVRLPNTDDSLKAGVRGPTVLDDFHLREKVMHFDHERIPERVVHARGAAAHGVFEGNGAATSFCAAGFLRKGVRTPVFTRFSTVLGSRGSADTVRDVRGFATKFYTDEGVFDLVGNNIPVYWCNSD